MSNNRSTIELLPLEIFTDAMPDASIADRGIISLMGNLSSTCSNLHTLFCVTLNTKKDILIKQLWQAVIDDDHRTLLALCKAHPNILSSLLKPFPKDLFITSRHTHQTFDLEGETLLTFAIKRKQIKMFHTLIYCYLVISKVANAKNLIGDALSLWKFNTCGKNERNEDTIILPENYIDDANSLVNAFKDENSNINKENYVFKKLFNTLLPSTPIKLDDYIDTQLLFIAVNNAFKKHLNQFTDLNSRLEFCTTIIRLIETAFIPETAKILCQGLRAVVEDGQPLAEKAESLIMQDEQAFYRPSREFCEKTDGFHCGIFGRAKRSGIQIQQSSIDISISLFNNYIVNDEKRVRDLIKIYPSNDHHVKNNC